jgi:flagellar basal body L-ring protein FlgH
MLIKPGIFVSFAAIVVLMNAAAVFAQNVPSSGTSAYTTSPAAAGLLSGSSTPPQLPIGLLVQRTNGSLLRAETYNLPDGIQTTPRTVSYYDVPEPKPKLLRKHDLVTIIIRENSQFTTNGTTDLKHANDLDGIIDSYVTLGWSGGGPSLDEHLPATPIQLQTSGQRDFKGTSTVERDDTFTGRITAEVVDVKPNGTLILQATETIKTDEEEQRVTLIGTCRVEDISSDNGVLSNQLFNLQLSKQHKGAAKDTLTRGLFTRLLDWINPF